MKEFFEKMISQKRKVEMMKEEYQRIKQSLDISGINYENNGGDETGRIETGCNAVESYRSNQ